MKNHRPLTWHHSQITRRLVLSDPRRRRCCRHHQYPQRSNPHLPIRSTFIHNSQPPSQSSLKWTTNTSVRVSLVSGSANRLYIPSQLTTRFSDARSVRHGQRYRPRYSGLGRSSGIFPTMWSQSGDRVLYLLRAQSPSTGESGRNRVVSFQSCKSHHPRPWPLPQQHEAISCLWFVNPSFRRSHSICPW